MPVTVTRLNGAKRGQIIEVKSVHDPDAHYASSIAVSMAGVDMEVCLVDHGEVASSYISIEAWRELNARVERMHQQQLQSIAKRERGK